jgi:hypothetical protein
MNQSQKSDRSNRALRQAQVNALLVLGEPLIPFVRNFGTGS